MLHNDNIENGMLKFWEKVTDEETGETWEREVPTCHCSECNKAIYADDNCYVMPKLYGEEPYILCEECIDSYVASLIRADKVGSEVPCSYRMI